MWAWASPFTELVFRESPRGLGWGSMMGCRWHNAVVLFYPLSNPDGLHDCADEENRLKDAVPLLGPGLMSLAVSLPVSQDTALRSLKTPGEAPPAPGSYTPGERRLTLLA